MPKRKITNRPYQPPAHRRDITPRNPRTGQPITPDPAKIAAAQLAEAKRIAHTNGLTLTDVITYAQAGGTLPTRTGTWKIPTLGSSFPNRNNVHGRFVSRAYRHAYAGGFHPSNQRI